MAKIINYEHSFVVEDNFRTEHQKGSVYANIKRGKLLIFPYGNTRSPIHTIPLKDITEPVAETRQELEQILRAFFFRAVITSNLPRVSTGFLNQKAYSFNGADTFINLYRPESLNFTPDMEFTIIIWIKPRSSANSVFLSKGRNNQRQFSIGMDNRFPVFHVGNRTERLGTRLQVNNSYMFSLRNKRQENGPYRFDCFINANKAGSNNAGSHVNDLDILIGARRRNSDNTGIDRAMNGEVDEVLFYNTPLSDFNIAELWSGGNLKNPSLVDGFGQLTSWYRAEKDPDSFPFITDMKGSNNGIFINGTPDNIITK